MVVTRRSFTLSLASAAAAGTSAGPASARGFYHSGPASDHFDGERFFNPGGEEPRGFDAFLRWQMSRNREPWPDEVPSPYPPDVPPARITGSGLRASFVGHATFLIQTGGVNILTDPVWSERASPVPFAGPKRHNPPGIDFQALPPIDAVLISHNHYDHLDLATLSRLWRRDRPLIVAPLGNDAIIRGHDPAIEVRSVDWGEEVALGRGVRALAEPAHHWSARALSDRNHALWSAFVVSGPGATTYFAGDTGFAGGRHFRASAARHRRIDLALLPIGAYEPRWFMSAHHMDPADAVEAMKLLGARQALGYHWGTFPLTDEGAERPATDLAIALKARGVPRERFLAARPGQVWTSASSRA